MPILAIIRKAGPSVSRAALAAAERKRQDLLRRISELSITIARYRGIGGVRLPILSVGHPAASWVARSLDQERNYSWPSCK
jgi:hypothetical protein